MKGQQVLEAAKIAFREATGGTLNILTDAEKEPITPFDILVELKQRKQTKILLVQVKNEMRKQDVPQVMELLRNDIPGYNYEKILIAQYIPGPVKEVLKSNQINYLEAAGNCFIELENLFLFVNDRKAAQARKTSNGKLWNKTGLKFVYAVLENPEILDLSLREQASRAGIALGNLTRLREELNEFLNLGNKGNAERNWKKLMEHWGLQYNHTLKPALKMGTFRFFNREMNEGWRNLPVPKKTWWGGENAAAIMTNYLRPQEFTVYTRDKAQVIMDWKLVPDENGDVILYEPFWPIAEDDTHQIFINPIITWAELNFELDQRLRETADRIKEKIGGFKNDG